MNDDCKEILQSVFCDVLERIAFMFGEPVDKSELPKYHDEYSRVSMNFSGQLKGSLSIAIPDKMSKEMAANVMGLDTDEDISKDVANDTLKEILNVTCGQFLTAYAGEEPVFELSIPEIFSLLPKGWTDLIKKDETICLIVDDYPVIIELLIED
jgi:CheY-specific phosphatase CheX